MVSSVLLVDDHELIRHGLRLAFDRCADFTVIAEAGSVADALRESQLQRPDVAVVDVRLPDGTGLELTSTLRGLYPDLGIVVLTMYAGDDQLFAALEAGASAFVSKNAPSSEVVAAARHASETPQSFTTRDLAGAMRRRERPRGPQLTERERQVLDLVAAGLSVSAISRKMFVSNSTTKTQIARVYEKLGANNRAQAVMNAVRLGLLGTVDDEAFPVAG